MGFDGAWWVLDQLSVFSTDRRALTAAAAWYGIALQAYLEVYEALKKERQQEQTKRLAALPAQRTYYVKV